MEPSVLTREALQALSRENVAETYLKLGASAEGSMVALGPAFDMCTSNSGLSFCNFAVKLRLDQHPGGVRMAVRELVSKALQQRAFRVFVSSGDTPEDCRDQLVEAGFCVQHRLIELAALEPTGISSLDLMECSTLQEREEITAFMAQQFFGKDPGLLRKHIELGTVRSGHSLYRLELEGKLVGGVMLTGMKSAVGLYNLCIDRQFRRRGLGGQVVASVQRLASEMKLPVLLQCEPRLATWYERLGFATIGEIKALSIQTSQK